MVVHPTALLAPRVILLISNMHAPMEVLMVVNIVHERKQYTYFLHHYRDETKTHYQRVMSLEHSIENESLMTYEIIMEHK